MRGGGSGGMGGSFGGRSGLCSRCCNTIKKKTWRTILKETRAESCTE